jgi:hypothetical protein
VTAAADATLLEEIRENRQYADTEWSPIREEARKDKLCVAGKPWEALDPDAVRERKAAKRPYLSSDELGQYLNQAVNDVRANPRGVRYTPTGNGANDAGAEFYQNHVREIEYRSHARVGYANAFADCVTSGYGWVSAATKRQHVRTFDQDLWINPVVNANQILSDPKAVWPDSRDMTFLLHIEPWARQEFKRKWPKARVSNFSLDAAKIAPGWADGRTVQVAKYWRLNFYDRQLVAYRLPTDPPDAPPRLSLVDELPDKKLPAGVENLREETVEDSTVECWLTNGVELLEELQWAGKYIPYVSCFGKVLYVDEGGGTKRQILSMTRLARDPYMLYCYMTTCAAEAVGGVPRAQWVGYEGQFAKPERWQRANRQPVAYLEARATIPGSPMQQPLPLPTRESWDPPLQNLEVSKEAARRAIQAAMGILPMPTDAQRRNDISGEAYKQRQAQGQKGSFHFVDSHDLMVERMGVILEDLMDKILDTPRDVPVRKADDTGGIIRVNDPQGSQYDGQRQLSGDPLFTKGDYRVTVSTGPATESQRVEAQDFVDGLMKNLAEIGQLAGSQRALKLLASSVKLKQLGPIGDQIIELLDPPVPGKDGKPLPPEVAQLMAENQQLKQLLEQAQAGAAGQAPRAAGQGRDRRQKDHREPAGSRGRPRHQAADRRDGPRSEARRRRARRAGRSLALFLEESQLAGARAHAATESTHERVHDAIQQSKDRAHEHVQGTLERAHAADLAAAAQAAAATQPGPAGTGV